MTSSPATCSHIVYLGETGFPFGLAPIQRQRLLSKGLVNAGAKVLIISNKGVWNANRQNSLPSTGTWEGVDYIYSSGEVFRRPEFLQRNFMKMKGLWKEFRMLINLKRSKRLDAAIVATMRFQSIFYYYLLSRLLKFKVLLNYVEYSSAISSRTQLFDRINDYLVDRIGIRCADALLPISEYLSEHVRRICPDKPLLKVPIVGDFAEPGLKKEDPNHLYFLYCGSAAYIELIEFIVDAFETLTHKEVFLYLVVSGDEAEMRFFESKLKTRSCREKIKVFSAIPYDQLLKMYTEACALLIPMRNTIQDIARFPHKIAEYLASGTPIITTNFGEIVHYFKDGVNALICDHYDRNEFTQKMRQVVTAPDVARRIGLNGRKTGECHFDYRRQGSILFDFIQTL